MEAVTRRELFMAAAAGQNVTLPEPVTREEMFLYQIAQNGGGGGGSGEYKMKPVFDGVLAEDVKTISFDGFEADSVFITFAPKGTTKNTATGGNLVMELTLDNGSIMTFDGSNATGNTASQIWQTTRAFFGIMNGVLVGAKATDASYWNRGLISTALFASGNYIATAPIDDGVTKIVGVTLRTKAGTYLGADSICRIEGLSK